MRVVNGYETVMKIGKITFLLLGVFTVFVCLACGRKGNPHPPKEYGGREYGSESLLPSAVGDFCE